MNTISLHRNVKWLGLGLLVIGVVALLSTHIANERLEGLANKNRLLIEEQKALLAAIAETTARNGADSITEQLITDCALSDRNQFNELLGGLDQGLTQPELAELEQLFTACGGFYSQRKAVMVARLSREIEVLETYVAQLEIVTGQDESTAQQLTEWQKLGEGEQNQSVLFKKLVQLQKQIIDTLLAGNTAESEEILAILEEVGQTREALLLAKTQTDTIRDNLTAL